MTLHPAPAVLVIRMNARIKIALANEVPARALVAGAPRNSRPAAFTLIEVVLAMMIAVGILAVVLFFYKQSELLRDQLLAETSHISAARLVLERLTHELSTARPCENGQALAGAADSLSFVRLSVLPRSVWTNQLDASNAIPLSPYRLVTYSLLQNTNDPTQGGLLRSERPYSGNLLADLPSDSTSGTNTDEALWAGTATEYDSSATNSASTNLAFLPTEALQYLRFRYWSGTNWADSWNGTGLPAGVEVSVGADPLPVGLTPEEYPFELYRRLICLPSSSSGQLATNSDNQTP